jgi:hypothetical protein
LQAKVVSMSDTLRRLYNKVDIIFDRHAISRELSFSRPAENAKRPVTAGRAFENIQSLVRELDREARLKLIVSQQGINIDGTSSCWEFFFDLPKRRAQLLCEWDLPWNELTDNYGTANIKFNIKPFPSVDSPIRQLVREGKLLHRQMISLWKQECRRRPDLPYKFRETDVVLADFLHQGLDVAQDEFSLRTGQSPQGSHCWIAQARNATFYAAFV